MSSSVKSVQSGHGPAVYGLMPQYTEQGNNNMKTANTGEYSVIPFGEHYNIRNHIPFDTNWGRSDWLDMLPLGRGEEQKTFAAPACNPQLLTDYRYLRYEPWRVQRPNSFLTEELRTKQ